MTAHDSMRLDDLREREQVRGDVLTEQERRTLATLEAKAREDWENEPAPRWLGGDYSDL